MCEFVTFPLVSWVRCGTWLYQFLIFAPLLTFIRCEETYCFCSVNSFLFSPKFCPDEFSVTTEQIVLTVWDTVAVGVNLCKSVSKLKMSDSKADLRACFKPPKFSRLFLSDMINNDIYFCKKLWNLNPGLENSKWVWSGNTINTNFRQTLASWGRATQ